MTCLPCVQGQTISSTYDALNRPLSLTADGSTRTFFYDPTGRWSGAVRGAAIDTIRTDIAGRDSVAITVRGSRVYTQRLGYGSTGQRTTHRLSRAHTTRRPHGATTTTGN